MGPLRSIEIPMFGFDESLVVEALLEENGIRHRKAVVHLGAGPMGGRHAYTFWVPEDRFHAAVELLKGLFGLEADPEHAYDACPACGAPPNDDRRCSDCGLNLSGDESGATYGHPFVLFLKRNGLL